MTTRKRSKRVAATAAHQGKQRAKTPRIARACLSLGLTGLATGCWTTPSDYSGHENWARWAVTAVHGRLPDSYNEVQALAALASSNGKGAVLDVLMADPRYTEYWTRVFMDDLEVAREGGDKPNDTACYAETKLSSIYYPALVSHLRSANHDTPFCPQPPIVTTQIDRVPSATVSTAVAVPGLSPATLSEPARAERTRTESTSSETLREARPTASVDGELSEELERQLTEFDQRFEEASMSRGPVVALDREKLVAGAQSLAFDPPLEMPEPGPVSTLSIQEQERLTQEGISIDIDDLIFPFCKTFTMRDVIQAALRHDAVDIIYRAQLVPMATHAGSRAAATGKFLRTFVNRDPTCIQCHNTHYSTTDAIPRNDAWDRFFPETPTDLEGTTFSYQTASGYHDGGMGGNSVNARVSALFRDDAWANSGGLRPFGMDASCTTQGQRNGFIPASSLSGSPQAGFAGLNGGGKGPLSLVDQLKQGYDGLSWNALTPAPYPVEGGGSPGNAGAGAQKFGLCEGCHQPGAGLPPPDLISHTRRMTPARLYSIMLDGSPAGLMPGGFVNATDAKDIIAFLKAQPGHVHNVVYQEPAAGLAHLVAQRIADNVVRHISSEQLTLEHGFSRSPEAAKALWSLTAQLVNAGWSLKAVIRSIALSDHAGRRAPAESPHDPYELPMLGNPWADVPWSPDVLAGEDVNGQGDLVHRWPVPSLALQLHHALGWPMPDIFPPSSSSAFFDRVFQREIGAYMGANNPGFEDVGFNALLAWEREMGQCPGGNGYCACSNPSPEPDYIDQLSDPGLGLSMEQAMLALKDRLLGDGQWWTSGSPNEQDLAAQLIAPATLTDPADSAPQGLRQYCAALLKSPQFLLAGLPAFDSAEPPPVPDEAACVGELCSFQDYCEQYAAAAQNLGHEGPNCEG